jgi:hypothetical protein
LRRERVASRLGSMVCATARRVLDPRNSWTGRLRLDRIGTRRRRSATGRRRAEATHSHGSGSGRRRPVGPQVALMGSARDARSPSRWANPMMRRTGGVPPASQKDPTTCISGCWVHAALPERARQPMRARALAAIGDSTGRGGHTQRAAINRSVGIRESSRRVGTGAAGLEPATSWLTARRSAN